MYGWDDFSWPRRNNDYIILILYKERVWSETETVQIWKSCFLILVNSIGISTWCISCILCNYTIVRSFFTWQKMVFKTHLMLSSLMLITVSRTANLGSCWSENLLKSEFWLVEIAIAFILCKIHDAKELFFKLRLSNKSKRVKTEKLTEVYSNLI